VPPEHRTAFVEALSQLVIEPAPQPVRRPRQR
jgi:hypothetical protein